MNRAERRRNNRAHDKEVSRRGVPPVVKPNSQHGVEVDLADDGFVYFTVYGGYLTLTVKWDKRDAGVVADMIRKCADGEVGKGVEVVRESGIVVPPSGFQL